MGRKLAVTLLLIAAAACSRGGTLGGPVAVISSEGREGAPTAFELAHATYSGIMDEPVTLTDGQWEGEPFVKDGASRPTVGLVDHFVLAGDLDGDGLDEAATLLWESSGGSGNRLYLAAMGSGDDVVANLGTALIGDRVQVRFGAIDGRQITLEIVQAGPEDAACCPTQKAIITWALGEDGLTRVTHEVTGTVSLADLEGPEWVLLELGWEQPVPVGTEITLAFREDKASGNAGCNSYFAGVAGPNPGELAFNGMGATRMACPDPVMDVERNYLRALAGASSYTFLAGRLVLGCVTDEGSVALIYAPRSTG